MDSFGFSFEICSIVFLYFCLNLVIKIGMYLYKKVTRIQGLPENPEKSEADILYPRLTW